MSERGVYAVDRGVWDHPGFAPEPYTEREAWLWMLGQASWDDRSMRVGRAQIDVKRGQFATANRYLATKWKWSEPRVRRFLKRREIDAQVFLQTTREATLITICNYDKYQFMRRTDVPEIDAQTDETATQSKETKKTNTIPEGSKSYAFESGVIRLNARDLDRWKSTYGYLDVPAELTGLTPWANQLGREKWFFAVQNALTNRNREAKQKADALKAQGGFQWNGIEGVV